MYKLDIKKDQGFKLIHRHTGEEIEIVYQPVMNPRGEETPWKARLLIEADQEFIILREGQSLEDKLASMNRKEARVGAFDDSEDEDEEGLGYFDYMLDT